MVSAIAFAAPGDTVLKLGIRGNDVLSLQNLLTNTGFYVGELDGIFGNATLAAVKDFQDNSGMVADGVVGSETFAYLMRANAEPSRHRRELTMTASAYSAYDPGNSSYTARGNLLRKGLVAVDTSIIPLGTRLYIPGYGYAIADDTGGSIRGNRIDLAFDSHGEALQFGVQRITVYIVD